MNTDTPASGSLFDNPWFRAVLAAGVVCLVGALLVSPSQRGGEQVVSQQMSSLDAESHPTSAIMFSLPDHDGAIRGLQELEGRPILLNFWASWCPPCLDEMPSLQRLARSLSDTDLALVAITLDTSWDDVDRVLAQTGFGEGVLVMMDADRAVAESYGTFKVPETYLIDRQGRIVHHVKGARTWDDEQTLEDLRAFATGAMPSRQGP